MNTCKHCGEKIVEGAFYCVHCGRLLDNVEERKVVPRSEYLSLLKVSDELKLKKDLLKELRDQGYAPPGKKLITDEDYNSMAKALERSTALISELNSKLNTIYSKGYAPSGMRLISDAEFNKLISISPQTKNKSSLPSWILWLVGVVFVGCLGCFFLSSNFTSSGLSDKALVEEKLSLPDDLAGYYMVKERDGKDGKGVAAKILQEDGQYSMSVYSSSITRKYFFAYNPETGILSSEELGNGRVEYVGKINQIKISFEGWILVK